MPVVGAGLSRAGLSPAGYGVASTAAAPNGAVLPDTVTSLQQSGRFINPHTKDYQLTADGRHQGMATVPQMVQIALTTTLGSSADPTLGNGLWLVTEKSANYVAQVRAQVQSALSYLIQHGFVRLGDVTIVEPPSNPDAVRVEIQWTDLTTNTQHTNTVQA